MGLLQACVLFIGVRKTMPTELCPVLLEVACAAGDAGARRRSQGAWEGICPESCVSDALRPQKARISHRERALMQAGCKNEDFAPFLISQSASHFDCLSFVIGGKATECRGDMSYCIGGNS